VTTVRLHKHHALGNDFLVMVVGENEHVAFDAALAVHACARHAGVGADGLLKLGPGHESGVDLTMELRNADGSPAEMSGNGLRCLVQAAARGGHAHPERDEVLVQTAAGIKAVRSKGSLGATTDDLVAEMGPVQLLGDATDWLGPGVERAAFADAGNPHLVMLVPDATHSPPLEEIGRAAQEKLSTGANVELVTPLGDGRIGMQVYERGVGITLACGTGACAAAAVARSWGLAGDQVPVEMAGGESVIGFRGDDAFLGGPVSWVADVDLAWPT
jgi:diaminopimelate epimerase